MDVVPSGSFLPRFLAFILLISALHIQTGSLGSPGQLKFFSSLLYLHVNCLIFILCGHGTKDYCNINIFALWKRHAQLRNIILHVFEVILREKNYCMHKSTQFVIKKSLLIFLSLECRLKDV